MDKHMPLIAIAHVVRSLSPLQAQVAKVYILPAQLRDAKSEVKRLEEAVKDKMLAEMEAKVEKAASRAKRSAEAGQAATTKRTKKATIVD